MVFLSNVALNASQSELNRLKEGFSNKVDSVVGPLLKRHKNSLLNLEKSLANVSKIEEALLVREERSRISKMQVSELIGKVPKSPESLRIQCLRFNREAASLIRVWEKKYEQTLVLLESRLTKSGKLNDALSAKNEIIKFRRIIDLRDKKIDNEEKLLDYALATKGAVAKAYKGADFLIDGNLDSSGSDGFAWGLCPSDFEVIFPKVTKIQEINFLLFDKDKSREYLYQLFAMRKEEGEWELIADHSKKPSKGWQKHKFSPAGIKSIKVKGIFNSANRNFQIIEVEAR